MSQLQTVLSSSRPKFLLLAPICAGLGLSAAIASGYSASSLHIALCLLIAIAAHASVNLLNEYSDAKTGLDDNTIKTPFSGGSGALQLKPSAANAVLTSGLTLAAFVGIAGLYLLLSIQWQMVIIGALGLGLVLAYTPWINQSSWLCLVAPGTGFGIVMVAGSYWVITGQIDIGALVCLPVFFLVNNLLLLNQFPDAKADAAVGRKHFVIRYGYSISATAYIVFVLATHSSIGLLVYFGVLPALSLATLIALPVGLLIGMKAAKFDGEKISALLPFMGLNVVITLVVPAFLILVLLF